MSDGIKHINKRQPFKTRYWEYLIETMGYSVRYGNSTIFLGNGFTDARRVSLGHRTVNAEEDLGQSSIPSSVPDPQPDSAAIPGNQFL
ncbi:hypothetical protein J6590_016909 [Homalodisca vitripennis]|nr:hypothetical protein J6590_016909 [Homalodisca vitripennis]